MFKDITPILSNGELFRASIDVFLEQCRGKEIDKIVGIDARGFLFGSAVAYELGVGFVPLRKKGRLPYKTDARSIRWSMARLRGAPHRWPLAWEKLPDRRSLATADLGVGAR